MWLCIVEPNANHILWLPLIVVFCAYKMRRPLCTYYSTIPMQCLFKKKKKNYSYAMWIWNKWGGFSLGNLIRPQSYEEMFNRDFGGRITLRSKEIWWVASFAIICLVWFERKQRIFDNKSLNEWEIWESSRFLASNWFAASNFGNGYSFSEWMRGWLIFCSLYFC